MKTEDRGQESGDRERKGIKGISHRFHRLHRLFLARRIFGDRQGRHFHVRVINIPEKYGKKGLL